MGVRRPQLAEDVSTVPVGDVRINQRHNRHKRQVGTSKQLRSCTSPGAIVKLVATEGADTLAPRTTERLLANRLGHTLEAAFGFEEQVTVWNRPGPGRLTLRGFEPDLYRIKP